MAFTVGMKVALVRETSMRSIDGTRDPSLNEVCTVAAVIDTPFGLNIDLVEYPRPENNFAYRGWRAELFRPVTERKTDISVFKAMLKPTEVNA